VAIIGFIFLVIVMLCLSGGLVFIALFDGAFGKRDFPIWVVFILLGFIAWAWIALMSISPFTVSVTG